MPAAGLPADLPPPAVLRAVLRKGLLTGLLAVPALALAVLAITGTPDPLILTYSLLPRILAALVAGALLGLGGAVFQRVFNNPLAEPSLLGITGGAALCMAATLVLAPVLWSQGYQIVALAGAGLALAAVLAIAWGPHLNSQKLVLAGVMVNLLCNAAYSLLALFNHDFLSNLLTWQAGSLQQNGWAAPLRLTVLALIAIIPLWLLERPLRLLALGDAGATSLGLPVRMVKLLMLGLVSCLAACVTAEFGQIGLIGLAAPALARAIGQRASPGLATAALTGALLLLTADQCMRLLAPLAGDLPVGAAAGLFAGPLLILLARRASGSVPLTFQLQAPQRKAGARLLLLLGLALTLAFAAALIVGRVPGGWSLALDGGELARIWQWRLPPLLGSASAGLCLALAGLLLQRLLRNPLASPDLLGIGHGAGLALALALVILPAASAPAKLAVTLTGAGLAMLAVTLLALRSRFDPARMLLIGAGIASTANALLVLVMAGGGQRGAALLGWFSGITSSTSLPVAVAAALTGCVCLAGSLLLSRRVDLVALGEPAAISLGVPVRRTRILGLTLAALATAAGTLVTGPVSFIGILVPHLVTRLGFRGTASASIACGLTGALLMTLAEWASQTLAWPWPLSPGLLAALLGGPCFLWLLRRQTAQG
ncbi:iron-hydroxamate transporter permease subunit [Pannonibacter phragmitetus]|uniref:Fe(3+)-hydroxamate ABC transporter permease FhuB n=1 Tax=Pannonibacter phragmitetus TaxID=121719 RepID=UPI00067DCC0F|nr:Fe(3+)-hydroxamate ABC transporter permease FhuB [Pannonibacter phragmitetus]KND16264.1 iron-hydroxamate transporter permease subunit [Pannonibacter phragmitetus]